MSDKVASSSKRQNDLRCLCVVASSCLDLSAAEGSKDGCRKGHFIFFYFVVIFSSRSLASLTLLAK